MDIRQYLRALRAHWFVVVALVMLGGVAAGTYSWLQTPQYAANVQLFVSISGSAPDVVELSQGGTFAQQRVKSYSDIVNSPSVMSAVIRDLQLPYTADDLASRVKSSSPLGTVLLDIAVTDSSPTRARDIANAIATQFPQFIATIETPAGATSSPVKLSVTRSASLPAAPVSPKTTLNLALGILVGLATGVGIAVLRHTLDRTIHGKREIATVSDAAVVGEVVDDAKTKKRPLIVDDTATPRAESFRRLRTNIRFLSIDERLRSLVVTGSLPDEGKSTVAANLAIALAQAGDTVVLIDGDLRKPSLATMFALPSGVGLTSVLLGDVTMDAALQHWRRDLPLYVVTSGPVPPNPSELLGSRRLADMVASMVANNMTVVFDSPPLLPVTDAAILARVTQGAIMVTRVGSTKIDQLETAIESLKAVDARILGVVANRVRRKKGKRGTYDGYYTAQPSGRGQGGKQRQVQQQGVPTPAARTGRSSVPTTGGWPN